MNDEDIIDLFFDRKESAILKQIINMEIIYQSLP